MNPHIPSDQHERSHIDHRRSRTRLVGTRKVVAALLGSSGWVLFAYIAILGRRYHVAGPILIGVIGLYTWAFWFFVVRRF